jgi:hypothetical protein
VTDQPATRALAAALDNWYRHAVALAIAVGVVAVTHVGVSSPSLRYGAYLVVFCVWMAWFVATTVDWISRADF